MTETYNDASITALKGADRVRKRPGVMFGSDDRKGAFHTLSEIIANSLDEARAGYGKTLTVTFHTDKSMTVLDTGRGVPMGWNTEEGRFNWDLVFNELYAGGKYVEAEEEGDTEYEFPLGLNGLGSAATQYTSEFMNVISWRKDSIFKKSFVKGVPTPEELTVEPNTTGQTGTSVHWKVDNEVFPDTDFTNQMFKDMLESQAHLNAITIIFIDENVDETVVYEGEGIQQYLSAKLGGAVLDILTKSTTSRGIEKGKAYRAKAEIVLAITDETKSKQMHFHNTATMRVGVGVHASAFESAVTTFFKKVAKDNGVSIIPYDYQDYLSVLSSTYSSITSFANQTKDGVSNGFVYDIIYNTVLDILEEAVAMKKDSITTLLQNVVGAALARKKAKELEQLERQVNKLTGGRKREKAEKYVDCKERDPKRRELFIVEGDSAKEACRNARDGAFQSLLPIKGKPMNGLKAKMEDLMKNQEVKDIVNTIGTGIDVAGLDTFDIEKRQFERIIITTDADIDGQQIRVLLYTIFYRLMPQLLEAGLVYVAETPLFELEMSNGKSWFAYTLAEKDAFMEQARKERLVVKKINRSKGLGENDPDMLWHTTMNPETRRLVQLKIDIKDQVVRDVSNMLFGDDIGKERKGFVFSLLETKLGEDVALNELIETIEALDSEREVDEEEVEAI
jgi:DNA gyrase subunit B